MKNIITALLFVLLTCSCTSHTNIEPSMSRYTLIYKVYYSANYTSTDTLKFEADNRYATYELYSLVGTNYLQILVGTPNETIFGLRKNVRNVIQTTAPIEVVKFIKENEQ